MNKCLMMFLGSLILAASCSSNKTGRKITIERHSKDDQVSKKIHQAHALYDMGEIDAAIASLAMLVDKSSYMPAYDEAYEVLVNWLLQANRYEEAKRYASYFLNHHQKSKSAQRIADLFKGRDSYKKEEKSDAEPQKVEAQEAEEHGIELDHIHSDKGPYHKPTLKPKDADDKSLGILLPLSGPFAPFGKKALVAMSLALDMPLLSTNKKISTFEKKNLKVFLADTSGNAQQTSALIDEMVQNHGVSLILGEITTDASIVASQRCQQLELPLISLSRHPLARDMGAYVFAFNISAAQQISHLVTHALKQGHTTFGILYPRHNYGIDWAQAFFAETIAQGGRVTALEAYDAHETNFSESVKKLVGLHYLSARPELAECERNPAPFFKVKGIKNCKEAMQPIVDFDALFIPEFNKLAFIVPALVHADLLITNNADARRTFVKATKIANAKAIQLLGPDSWNDHETIAKLGRMANGAYFVGSVDLDDPELLALKEALTAQDFAGPTTLEVYAHDAARLAAHVLSSVQKMKGDVKKNIKGKLANFSGKVGFLKPFSFSPANELVTQNIGFEIKDGTSSVFINEPNSSAGIP